MRKGAFWERVRKRSPLKWVKVQQVAIIAQEHDWKMSDELRDLIRNDLAGITQTKLVEDAVRSERLAESKGSSNTILCGGKCWDVLIQDSVENEKHRFKKLDCVSEV